MNTPTTTRFHIITPFSRPHNFGALWKNIQSARGSQGVIWTPVVCDAKLLPAGAYSDLLFLPMTCGPLPQGWDPCYWKLNFALDRLELDDETVYGFLCDDDTYDANFFDGIAALTTDIRVCSARRNGGYSGPLLWAEPANMRCTRVGLEQFFIRGSLMRSLRFNNHPWADGQMVEKLWREMPERFSFAPHTFSNWNFLPS